MLYVQLSQNAKTGPVDATYASVKSTCPPCPSKDDGTCYAMGGRVAFTVRRLDAQGLSALDAARAEASAIDASWRGGRVPGVALRLHVAGDTTLPEGARLISSAVRRRAARGGGPAWTYTHAWHAVPRADWAGVSILASVDSLDDVAAARAQGYAPALVVAEHPADGRAFRDAEGRTWIPCLEQTRGTPCTECRLCWNADALFGRNAGITFAAHGVRESTMRKRLPVLQAAPKTDPWANFARALGLPEGCAA